MSPRSAIYVGSGNTVIRSQYQNIVIIMARHQSEAVYLLVLILYGDCLNPTCVISRFCERYVRVLLLRSTICM
jgi:hypothetical protein